MFTVVVMSVGIIVRLLVMSVLLSINIAQAGTIYSADGSTVVAIDSVTMNETFSFNTGVTVNGLVVDGTDGIYLTSANSIYKYSTGGLLLASYTFPSSLISYQRIAVQGTRIYAVVATGENGVTIRLKDSLSTQQAFFGPSSDPITGVDVAGNGVIHITTGNSILQYSENFAAQTDSFTFAGVTYHEIAFNNGKTYTLYTQGSVNGVTVRDVNLNQNSFFTFNYIPADIAAGPGDVQIVSGGFERLNRDAEPGELGIVATPTNVSVAAAERLMSLGFKDILIEKPVFYRSEVIDSLAAKTERKGVNVRCALQSTSMSFVS